MQQRASFGATVALVLGVVLSLASSASALRCYECASAESWSDCHSNAIISSCSTVSQVSLLGQDIFLPAQARQLELACLSVAAEASIGGITGTAFVRQCFFNDKSMCSLIESELPAGFRVKTCDLCTTDLCNGASSVTIALSSVLLMAIAAMLRH